MNGRTRNETPCYCGEYLLYKGEAVNERVRQGLAIIATHTPIDCWVPVA